MKKFLVKIVVAFLSVLLIWGGLYLYYYSEVFPNQSGDIGSLGKIPFGKKYEAEFSVPFPSHMVCITDTSTALAKDTSLHVAIVGDSFSHRGNTGFVNFTGLYLGEKVAFFDWDWPNPNYNPTSTLIGLLNSGYFQGTSIRTVVLDVVERNFVSNIMDANLKYCGNNLRFHLGNRTPKKKDKNIWQPFLDTKQSFEEARNYLVLRSGVQGSINREKLSRDFFTACPDELYYYSYDLCRLSVSQKEQAKIKTKLMELKDLAASKGIRLIVMMPVDKYDLYQPYIVGNGVPQNMMSETLRTLVDSDFLIISKPYLRAMLAKGEKDVFLANDTHWSYKAANVMGKVLAREIRKDL